MSTTTKTTNLKKHTQPDKCSAQKGWKNRGAKTTAAARNLNRSMAKNEMFKSEQSETMSKWETILYLLERKEKLLHTIVEGDPKYG